MSHIERRPDKGFSQNRHRFSVYIDGTHVAEVIGSPTRLSDGDKRVKHWDRYKQDYLTPGWRGQAYTVVAITDAAKPWEGPTWYTADYAWQGIQDMYNGIPIRGEDLSPPAAP
ncbi:MAG: hypothetical protein OXE02_06095 [Chloroflexi bacterium]|nr:hypothetical protein [Chloroflexota bacterium]